MLDPSYAYDGPEWEGEERHISEAWVEMRLILIDQGNAKSP